MDPARDATRTLRNVAFPVMAGCGGTREGSPEVLLNRTPDGIRQLAHRVDCSL